MVTNISNILEIQSAISELNKAAVRILVVSEIRTGAIIGIYDTEMLTQAEGLNRLFQVRGREISKIIDKYNNISSIIDNMFASNYKRERDLLPSSQFWFSENQFGYIWCIS